MNIKEEQLNFTFPFWILVLFTTFFKCSKERIHKKRDRRWEKFHRSELPAHFTLFKEHMVRSHAKTKHEKKMYLEWMFFHLQCCFASAWNSEQLGFPLVVTFIFEFFSLISSNILSHITCHSSSSHNLHMCVCVRVLSSVWKAQIKLCWEHVIEFFFSAIMQIISPLVYWTMHQTHKRLKMEKTER